MFYTAYHPWTVVEFYWSLSAITCRGYYLGETDNDMYFAQLQDVDTGDIDYSINKILLKNIFDLRVI
jgi:hypothetical protein